MPDRAAIVGTALATTAAAAVWRAATAFVEWNVSASRARLASSRIAQAIRIGRVTKDAAVQWAKSTSTWRLPTHLVEKIAKQNVGGEPILQAGPEIKSRIHTNYLLRVPAITGLEKLRPKLLIQPGGSVELPYDTLQLHRVSSSSTESSNVSVQNGAVEPVDVYLTLARVGQPDLSDAHAMWNTTTYDPVQAAHALGVGEGHRVRNDSERSVSHAYVYVATAPRLCVLARGVVAEATDTLRDEFVAQGVFDELSVRSHVISPHVVRWIVTAEVETPWYSFTADVPVQMSVQLRLAPTAGAAPRVWAGSHVGSTATCVFRKIKRGMEAAERKIETEFARAFEDLQELPAGLGVAFTPDGDLWLCAPPPA